MNKPSKLKQNSVSTFVTKYNLVFLLLLFVIVSTIISRDFLTINNFHNLMRASAFNGIIAIGMTIVILIGGIDLSVGAVANFSGMMIAFLLMSGVPTPVSIILTILLGLAFGTVTGVVITVFKIPPFIGSLAMALIARGLALLVTNGKVINNLPEDFTSIAKIKLPGGFPILGVIWIVLTILFALTLRFTPFGRRMYTLGGNREAAFLSGVRIKLHGVLAYVISGGTAALAGCLMVSYLSIGQPTAIQGAENDAIAAVVLGGTSMTQGGIGGVIGTFGGVFLLKIITNIFNLIGVPAYFQYIFQGIIIIGALVLNKLVIQRKD